MEEDMKSVFQSQIREKDNYIVIFEPLDETDAPVVITRSEFMRRMKEMAQFGGGMNFYGNLPDSYNLVVNSRHSLIGKLSEEVSESLGEKLKLNETDRSKVNEEIDFMEKEHKNKKQDEISQHEKDDLDKMRKELDAVNNNRRELLEAYGKENKIVKQLIDLALLANNMLRGEDLSLFVKRSVELL
jgi:molecular chaperone HtpG